MQLLEVSGAVRPLKWPLGVKWLISSVGLLPSSCIILYYMVDAQLLFKPGLLPHREQGERCILQQNVGVHSV
jgi:hypothetical protein